MIYHHIAVQIMLLYKYYIVIISLFIYKITVNEDFTVNIEMTLTAPNCPVAESLPEEVREKVSNMVGIKNATVEIVFEPPWDKEMMSEEAKLDLGFL